jgi:hypothetical protein
MGARAGNWIGASALCAVGLLACASQANAQDVQGFKLGGVDFRNIDDRQIKRGLTLASDSMVALSAGPGVGGARFRLKRSRFFDRIQSTQIKLRLYITGNLLPGGPDDDQSLIDRESQKLFDTTEAVTGSLLGREDEEGAEEEVEPESEEPEEEQPLLRARLFVLGSYGSAKAITDFPVLGDGPSELVVTTTSYRIGGGVRLDIFKWFSVLPTLTVAYNKAHGDREGNGRDSALLRLNSNRKLVNWRSESISVIPQIDFRFRYGFDPFELRLTIELSYLRTRSFSASTELQEFESDSLLTSAKVEFDWNTKYTLLGMEVHVVPALRYVRLGGESGEALGTQDLMGVSLAIESDTSKRIPFASRLGARVTYLWGLNLEAWSVGLTYDF